jgi:hypothetical protein
MSEKRLCFALAIQVTRLGPIALCPSTRIYYAISLQVSLELVAVRLRSNLLDSQMLQSIFIIQASDG